MNKSKTQFIKYFLAIIIIFMIYILITTWKDMKMKKEMSESELIPASKVEDTISHDDIALTAQDTMAPGEYDIQSHPDRLLIKNKSILADTTLPSYGYKTLDAYLTEYFDYYWDNGTNYYAEIVEDSFEGDYNLPSFKIYVEELDLEIRCVWYSSRQVYHFYSRLNQEEES